MFVLQDMDSDTVLVKAVWTSWQVLQSMIYGIVRL